MGAELGILGLTGVKFRKQWGGGEVRDSDGSFSFFKKRSFRYENDEEKTKRSFKNDRFLMEIVLTKRSFSKRSFLKS